MLLGSFENDGSRLSPRTHSGIRNFPGLPSKEKRPRRNRSIKFSIKPVSDGDVIDDFKPTTVPQLRLLCWKIKPWREPKSFKLFSSQFGVQWGVDCDEVHPGKTKNKV